MWKKALHMLRVVFFGIFLLTNTYSLCQNNYPFTPPRTIYTKSFHNSNQNGANKFVIKVIEKHQPIYLNGSAINNNPNYISDKLKKYKVSHTLLFNYYVHQYIKTYSASPEKIAFLTNFFNYYSRIVRKSITKNNLPKHFELIPLICSAYDPLSDNERGGSGFWHLNYAPAIKYGLTINAFFDERKDIQKATQVATTYLKDLYTLYQDWDLALAAYSCGVTTVNKTLKRTESSSFWEIYPYLPTKTRDLVPALSAMTYCFNEAHNDSYLLQEIQITRDTIEIDHDLYIAAIHHVLQIDTSTLLQLNPTINQHLFPKGFNAIFPEKSKPQFMALKDSIYFYQDSVLLKPKTITPVYKALENGEPFTYKVKSGDVLGIIAERFGVRVSQLQDWNNLNGTRINIGQTLTIYGKKENHHQEKYLNKKNPVSPTPKEDKTNGAIETYIVKSGDSLWLIAKKYPGVSAQEIMELNGIDENLKIGQLLKIKKK